MDRQGMQTQGTSHERLERAERFIDDVCIATGELPGTLVQAWRRGELASSSVLGPTDRERQVPLAEDPISRIYSMTKPIASVAFMMLVEGCRVVLDDLVGELIPMWANLGVHTGGFMGGFQSHPVKCLIRIVDLLRHTPGLAYGFHQNTNADTVYHRLKLGDITTDGTLDKMIEKLAGMPLEFSLGEVWNYPVSAGVLGYLIDKTSGMPFETFLKEWILNPLGMADTALHISEEKAPRLCVCHTIDALGSKVVSKRGPALQGSPRVSPYLKPPSLISGGDGLISTTADYLRFLRMLLQGGELDGTRLLAPRTLALTTANHPPGGHDMPNLPSPSMFSEAVHDGVGSGLGFAITISQAIMLILDNTDDLSQDDVAGTFFWVDPQEGLIDLFLVQVLPSSAYPVYRQLRMLVYSMITDMGGAAR